MSASPHSISVETNGNRPKQEVEMNSATRRCTLVLITVLTLSASMTFGQGIPKTATKPASKTAKPTTAMNISAFQGALGETPTGWFVPTAGYSARLVAEGARAGRHSVLLQKDAQTANADHFG